MTGNIFCHFLSCFSWHFLVPFVGSSRFRLWSKMDLHAPYVIKFIPTRVQKLTFFFKENLKWHLKVLEVCVRNSGKLFHNEIGKYRFLNELIRVVSPKYLGPRSNPEVKKRIVEIMYRSVQILSLKIIKGSPEIKGTPDQSHFIINVGKSTRGSLR